LSKKQTEKQIMSSIASLLADVLEVDKVKLTEATTADQIEDWDSINHVRLLIAIEREFGFEFASNEATGLRNVGALVSMIKSKIG
jgi:acyl carrier protein